MKIEKDKKIKDKMVLGESDGLGRTRPDQAAPVDKENPFVYSVITPPKRTGWLDITLPQAVMERLWKYIDTAKKDPVSYNKRLAGNISSSILIEDEDNWFSQNYLSEIIPLYEQAFPDHDGQDPIMTTDGLNHGFRLEPLWANFMKKHEFNPPHNHGGLYSFVIFLKIPYSFEEQTKLPHVGGSNSPSAGNFAFSYVANGVIEYYVYPLSTDFEGQMIFFNSQMIHQVYPFYNSDDERVTISGIVLRTVTN